jgi:hypothetical protein
MQPAKATLEEVTNLFELWQNNNPKSKFSSIPTYLKERVKQLLEFHSITQIAKTLSISRATLYSIIKNTTNSNHTSSLSSNKDKAKNLDFIPFQLLNPIEAADTITPKKSNYTSCHIIKPNGTKLTIQTFDPKTIIQAFLCSN